MLNRGSAAWIHRETRFLLSAWLLAEAKGRLPEGQRLPSPGKHPTNEGGEGWVRWVRANEPIGRGQGDVCCQTACSIFGRRLRLSLRSV